MRHMVVIVPELTGYASIRHVAVSLPYAAQLIDGKKYMLPGNVKPPEGGTEKRRQRAPRMPSMRTLVRWAQKCDSAEQLGAAETQIRSPTTAPRAGSTWRPRPARARRPTRQVAGAGLTSPRGVKKPDGPSLRRKKTEAVGGLCSVPDSGSRYPATAYKPKNQVRDSCPEAQCPRVQCLDFNLGCHNSIPSKDHVRRKSRRWSAAKCGASIACF
jgi:hypothetical protein